MHTFAYYLVAAAVTAAVYVSLVTTQPMETADFVSLSTSLYSCSNGNPGVAKKYANGWGTLDGDWYGIAANADGSSCDCLRSSYEVYGKKNDRMSESSLFLYDGSTYGWNSTLDELRRGKWERSEYEGKRPSWTEVWDVGVFDGERYFGLYFCGDICSATRKGWAVVYKEGPEASDEFLGVARRSMRNAGLLDHGRFEAINQTSCTYFWW